MSLFQIYIGYDPKEAVAYHTLAHSILRRSSIPVTIAPVMQSQLMGLYTRARGETESTEFSLTRFLVPAMSQYRGWSLFMDCDMLCRADIAELAAFTERSADKAVLVCKHDYVPNPSRKFLNQVQTIYPRKNWSSVMLLNNERCGALSPEYVNAAMPKQLHRFEWTEDALVGDLPIEWNWLVGEYAYNAAAKNVHFTRGGPYFEEFKDCDYAAEWFEENRRMTFAASRTSA
ncbi:MAG TPA: glycosyltransferase [Burkholderiales bacterium]|nr:glycosyltransferase [Burkholderiales bacterium]